MSDTILAQLPATLDQIVTRNRDRFQIGLITDEQFEQLERFDSQDGVKIKQVVLNWRIIAFHQPKISATSYVLLGSVNDCGKQISWVTSEIIGFDPIGIIKTKNSYYRIDGERQTDEPPLEDILLLVYYLRKCGLTDALGLVEVFY